MTDNTAKIALLETLKSDYDHVFMSPEGVAKFCEPFGLKLPSYMHKANPHDIKGLSLKGGARQAEGRDAAEVAEAIARHLGCPHSGMMGRGFRLRAACDAAIAKLKSEDQC